MFVCCFFFFNIILKVFLNSSFRTLAFRTRVLIPRVLLWVTPTQSLPPHHAAPTRGDNDSFLTCFSKLHDSVKISNKDESRKEEAIFLCLVSGWVVSAWAERKPGLRTDVQSWNKTAEHAGTLWKHWDIKVSLSRVTLHQLAKPGGRMITVVCILPSTLPRVTAHGWFTMERST